MLGFPLAALVVLRLAGDLDRRWYGDAAHFWLVLIDAVLAAGLGMVMSQAGRRRADARVLLAGLACLASAGFLGLHALATPSVLLEHRSVGFVIAAPVGLIIAAGFAAASSIDFDETTAATVMRHQRALRLGLAAVLVAWAAISLVAGSPLGRAIGPERASSELVVLGFAGVALYAVAAVRYARHAAAPAVASSVRADERVDPARRGAGGRGSGAELVRVVVGMAPARHARGARRRVGRGRRVSTALIGPRPVHESLPRAHARPCGCRLCRGTRRAGCRACVAATRPTRTPTRSAIAWVSAATSGSCFSAPQARSTASTGCSGRICRRSSHASSPPTPRRARLGGEEREVSLLFADLEGFTAFSEQASPATVIAMLNEYWSLIVPEVLGREDGLIERFSGDAIMVMFNATGEQPDHALRAARAALALQRASATLTRQHPDWPRFRVGVNTGWAIVGNVGTADQRSFAAIGDATNHAARLQAVAAPGEIVIGETTRLALAGIAELEPLAPLRTSRESTSRWSPTGSSPSALPGIELVSSARCDGPRK